MTISRRFFLTLPVLSPLRALRSGQVDEHRFHYDHILGTSMDLAVWTTSPDSAEEASRAALDEVERLERILSTYREDSEIRRFQNGGLKSRELAEVFELYRYWEERTEGSISIRPSGNALNVAALGKAYILERAETDLAGRRI